MITHRRPTIHFVYAYEPNDGQISAPASITTNLFNFLSSKTDVKYYHWDSHADLKVLPYDIVIGHPHYNTETIIQKFFRSNQQCKAKCTIHPFHHNRVHDNMPFDHLTRAADAYFAICGPYWYDTMHDTLFEHWKEKTVRLDMAVNSEHFPYLKKSFNPIGQRKLLYMGSNMPQKNLGFLTEMMRRMPDVQLVWYGGDSNDALARLPNVTTHGRTCFNAAMAQRIVAECDIFVNTSISDANPTTLLESTAWGLVAACTKESGYYNDPMFDELELGDIDKSISVVRNLLLTPEDVLLERSRRSREVIEKKYNWDNFCNTVWAKLSSLM